MEISSTILLNSLQIMVVIEETSIWNGWQGRAKFSSKTSEKIVNVNNSLFILRFSLMQYPFFIAPLFLSSFYVDLEINFKYRMNILIFSYGWCLLSCILFLFLMNSKSTKLKVFLRVIIFTNLPIHCYCLISV